MQTWVNSGSKCLRIYIVLEIFWPKKVDVSVLWISDYANKGLDGSGYMIMAYNARYVGQRYDTRVHHPTFTATSNVVLVAATQVGMITI